MPVLTRVRAALRSDALGGCLMIAAALIALIWANSPAADGYRAMQEFSIGPSALHLALPLHAWAADGLLAIFFFIVGNELKQELAHGELRDPRRATLPIAAALGGVIVPIGVFLVFNASRPNSVDGWGIPMATDIAFALAILAIFGRRLPAPLRTFLLTLATVDDLCAVLVIAVHHTAGVSWIALAGAGVGLAIFGWLQAGRDPASRRLLGRVPGWLLFGPLAVVIWTLTHLSGVHATMAGVAMGLLMRTRVHPNETESPSQRAEHRWRPVSAGVALPVFALMSAGISLSGTGNLLTDPIAWGVAAGLVVGKPIGIMAATWLTARFTPARLNPLLGWWDVAAVGLLGGIGFTVSFLITELSYSGSAALSSGKAAVLFGSVTACVLAAVVLMRRGRRSTG